MLHDTKPPLDEALLIHYGVPGMKWGVRRTRPDGAQQKARFNPKTKKIAAGVAIAAGAAAVAILLGRSGQVPVRSLNTFARASLKPTASQNLDALRAQQGKVYANKLRSGVMNQTLHFDKRQKQWVRDAGSALVRTGRSASRSGATRAASTARESVYASRLRRSGLNLGDINAVRDAMNDPNFVWDL